jgi:uncharacterized iron-regulated protein
MPNDLQIQLNQLKADLEALNAEVYTNNFTSSQDFNKFTRFNTRLKVPIFAVAPTVAEIGELYANSTNGRLFVCTAANVWSLVGTQT